MRSKTSLGNSELAKEILRALLTGREQRLFPYVHETLGEILAFEHDPRGAAAEYRQFLELRGDSRLATRVRALLAQWKASGVID